MAALRTTPPNRRRQAGLSLVELMIAITIYLFLMAGMATLITQQSSARADLDKSARQVESGRYAFTLLQDDIQHAGYYGQYGAVFAALSALLVVLSLLAVSAVRLGNKLDYGIDGTGTGVPATPFVAAPASADWPNVMTVQVRLLARNTEASSFVDSILSAKTYNMGVSGPVGPFSDKFKRHVYTITVQVVTASQERGHRGSATSDREGDGHRDQFRRSRRAEIQYRNQ
ncbi:PilW family protein [Cupriavidus sp. CuC1]|uniref:PilW family protein n=1 Tax=Cupriavidus sp. CuC1 TaxID=3373131 RepID=UPI0037D51D38